MTLRSVVSVLLRAWETFLYTLKAGLRAAACGGRPRPTAPPYLRCPAAPGPRPAKWKEAPRGVPPSTC